MFTVTADRKLYELECLRGFAACYVVAYHIAHLLDLKGPLSWPLRFGQEAVLLFFVLSGFVIHLSSKGDWSAFWRARATRIYPIFLFSLLLAYAVKCVLAGQFVGAEPGNLLGNLVMLQDRPKAGNIVEPYMHNAPLWSLSYEWIFYGLYWLIVRYGPRQKTAVALSISAMCFVGLMFTNLQIARFGAYFMLWWLGVGLCELYKGRGARTLLITSATVSVAILALAVGAIVGIEPATTPKVSAHIELRHFAAALAAIGLILVWSKLGWRGFRPLMRVFGSLAPISYALYLVHYPLLQLTSVLPLPPIAGIAAMLAVSLALAWFLECIAQPWFGRRTRRQQPIPTSA